MAAVRRARRSARTAIALIGVVAWFAFWLVPNASGTTNVTTKRLAGADRYGTARAIANDTFASTGFAVLARGDDYPDALAGAYLAGGDPGGPVVLTERTRLTPDALGALRDVGAKAVFILGGNSAIDPSVEQDLKNRGYTTYRVAGATRYDTAKQTAETFGVGGVGSVGNERTAILASGVNYPDALSGGPASFKGHLPLLLTTPSSLSPEADQALSDLKIDRVLVLGGAAAVTNAVETTLTSKGYKVTRLAGANRQATAVAVADYERKSLGFDTTHVNLARGDAFADSLAGGPHGGHEAAPVLLTASPTDLGAETRGDITAHRNTISSIDAFGGQAAISDAVLADAKNAATSGTTTSGTGTTTTGPSTTTTTGPSTTTTTQVGPGGITCPPFPPQFCQAQSTTTTSSSTTTTTPNPIGAPRAQDLRAASSNGLVDTGDTHQFVFSEAMDSGADDAGQGYRVTSGATKGDIICGSESTPTVTANAICVLEPAATYNGVTAVKEQVLRVRLTGAPFVPGTTQTVAMSYPVTLDTVSSGWKDKTVVPFDVSGSPDKTIDVAAIAPAPNATAATISSVSTSNAGATAALHMSEPVTWYMSTMDQSSFSYDSDSTTAGPTIPASSVSISDDGLTITVNFPPGTIKSDLFLNPNQAILYIDEAAGLDNGDVVDVDGNPMPNRTAHIG